MSLIYKSNLAELDKKIEYLLTEKHYALEEELRMTSEVLRKIKTNCNEYYSSKQAVPKTPQKFTQILEKHKFIACMGIISFIPLFFLFISPNDGFIADDESLDTKYLVQNLKGDIIDTWNYWDIPADRSLYVSIIGANLLNSNYYQELENAILSEETISFDKSLFYKVPKGTDAEYYLGWKGALKNISTTKYPIPTNFQIISSENSQNAADIIITLTTQRDPQGIHGYTKSLLEGNNILKSYITIYEVDKLSKNQLSTIIRHEFGHALGLAHTTATEDLMAPTITTSIPFISECNVSAISSLYEGNRQSKVVCEI